METTKPTPALPNALTESLRLLAEIQAAISAGDVKAIRQTGDTLKGSITSVLAKEAFNAASTLERTLHEDDLASAQDACRRLREAINSLNRGREHL
jgi:HPt (histidine-containing phosphotransfer) domain-containing protein